MLNDLGLGTTLIATTVLIHTFGLIVVSQVMNRLIRWFRLHRHDFGKTIAIVEVKSSLEDYRVDRKWGEYAPFCDQFFFAVAPEFPRHVLPEGPGLIVADNFGGAILTPSPTTPLAPARRKALTLAFARLAALRAAGIAAATA